MGTRQIGQHAGPITYAEAQAFNASTLASLSAWDIELIRDIDDVARGVALGILDPTNPTKPVRKSLGSMLRERVEAQRSAS